MTWEHLQSVIMQVHNRIVREEFSEVSGDDDNISTPRSSLRSACLVRDADSATTVLNRFFLFYVMLRKASDFHPPLYTTPSDGFQQLVQFHPQVTMYFREDLDTIEEGYSPLEAEVSFRIVNERYDTITKAELTNLANKIRAEFATGQGYRWRKGRTIVTYRDKRLSYELRLYAASVSEARQVIQKVLSLQGHTLDPSKLKTNDLVEAPPVNPGTHTVLGKTRRKPRTRPVGYVRFLWAEAHVWGVQNAIVLIDRSGRRYKPLVSA